MSAWKVAWLIVLAIAVSGLMLLVAAAGASVVTSRDQQDVLQPFYTPPDPLPGPPGTVIRTEPLGVDVPGATALRMLYVSERADGTPAASGGMIFIPEAPAPPGDRPVVAWAHGTLGMGDACVPSRSGTPLNDMDNWLDRMMELGWVVVATDYVGLGTPGPNQYLIAQSEVRDVVNSVRAARGIPEAEAGTVYATWGHSQGGHSSIWTGHLGQEYAPELQLVGVAAAAPALELPDIMTAQWDEAAAWAIGPDVLESWPTYYPDLPVDTVLSKAGSDTRLRLAAECIKESALEGLARQTLGQRFFAEDPMDSPPWAAAAADQTPDPLPPTVPAFIAQGLDDQVVLPWPNAIVQERWCEAGSNLSVLWLGDVNHIQAAMTAGPAAVQWLADRFAGRPASRTCDVPLPIPPSMPPDTTP